MTAALELAGVSSGYGEALVLRSLDLTVQPGETFALLGKNPKPTDDDINAAMSSVICRCGTYQRIRQAIHRAAEHVVPKAGGEQ